MAEDTQRYSSYRDQFLYSGERIYELIYERNKQHIRTKRRAVALVNLRRIFEHTFTISKRDGFREMSLRQLSHESGISIGGIYACIESKQALAQMACDCVTFIGVQHMQMTVVPRRQPVSLQTFVRRSVYLAEAIYEWLRFLFVDVRSLDDVNARQLSCLSDLFVSGVGRLQMLESDRSGDDAGAAYARQLEARLALLLVGDWVQQRDDILYRGISIEDYADYAVQTLVGASRRKQTSDMKPAAVEALSGVDVL